MSGVPFETFLYYWDDRDGINWQGWWIAPDVGSSSFMAFARGDAETPVLCPAWRRGDSQLIDMHVAWLGCNVIGVRAPNICFEGVYTIEATHPHEHGGRPVFRRVRDLEVDELHELDRTRTIVAADVVVYSRKLTLADVTSTAPAKTDHDGYDAIIGVPLNSAAMDAESLLAWVQGADSQSVQAISVAGSAHAALSSVEQQTLEEAQVGSFDPQASPSQSIRIESMADLDLVLTKGATECLTIPELADEDSPLPMGWVLAARSTHPEIRTVREHVLLATEHLDKGVSPDIRALPQVDEQIRKLRSLVEDLCFTICVWNADICEERHAQSVGHIEDQEVA